ncbi:cobalamin-dependent protein [Nannocystis sp. SCPEA4]|uniref:cobalamin B12-binding domain-containing protein n=1 Tax=Nannocystis sp. SCPEA4 TaxID=2996787 RepID=UPI00226E0C22|nr:cobalamin-dependent protein [Nannocystis sp. SCPEA4]
MTPALDQLRECYLRAQLAGDRREAVRLLLEDGLGAGAQVEELQIHVVRAAQDEIGRLWQLNRVSIAQEHLATAISHLSLAALFERATPRPALGRRVLLACVEGELHELPARLVADVLELDGFDVHYLGANVPTHDLVGEVRTEQPDVIGLSVTMSFNLPALRAAVAGVRGVSERPLFIGGHATRWSPGLARELDVAEAGSSPAELVATARRLAGVQS